MPNKIEPLPRLPEQLLEAAALGNLVPFVGAGVSRLAGCVTWAELASKAIDALVDQRSLSPLQRSQLGHLSPRLKLSLAELTAKEKKSPIPYREILQPKGWDSHREGRRIYANLGAISNQFVTTNYDEWLDIPLPPLASPTSSAGGPSTPTATRTRLYLRPDIDPAKFRRGNCVMHLHGSVADTDSMILTTSHYIEHYATDRDRVGGEGENPVLSFLNYLFGNRTILFIGYGLEELEILEYVLLKSRSTVSSIETKHFLLQGFYSIEADFCEALEKYYSQFGVTLIPFLKDENDWSQLSNVVEHIASALPAPEVSTISTFAEMKRMLHG